MKTKDKIDISINLTFETISLFCYKEIKWRFEGAPHFACDERPTQYLKLLREDKAFVYLVESVISFPQKLHKDEFNDNMW